MGLIVKWVSPTESMRARTSSTTTLALWRPSAAAYGKIESRHVWRIMTQTIELPLPEELLRLVDERAQIAGLARDAFIRSVLQNVVTSGPSLGETLGPFRDQVTGSGLSDQELDRLFSEARDESYRERNTTNR
jgi:hypothetical protein